MNTRKRLAAMRTAGVLQQSVALDNPACMIGAGQRCEHALVDPEQNQRLFVYEATVRGRFSHIVDTLKILSAMQHETDFVERAQRVAAQLRELLLISAGSLRGYPARRAQIEALHTELAELAPQLGWMIAVCVMTATCRPIFCYLGPDRAMR
jgi:hypothetical protein